ncbi:MAG: HAD family phosphatase, partial [Bacilli bacterium]|nr:HAD family phosphatase [Bacilli bacterium]
MIKIKGKEIKGFIFDLDGTLLDSLGVWKTIDENFFSRHDLVMPSDYSASIAHLGLEGAASYTIERFEMKNVTVESVVEEWIKESHRMYHEVVMLKQGALEVLEFLKENNVLMTIATAGKENLFVK